MTSTILTLTGSVHRFGKNGVLYEVLRQLNDTSAHIRVIDTGEETPYALEKILADPTD